MAFRRVAFLVALAFFFLHTVGENAHIGLHALGRRAESAPRTTSDRCGAPETHLSALTSHERCPFCALGNTLAVTPWHPTTTTLTLRPTPPAVFRRLNACVAVATVRAASRAPPLSV